MVLFSTTIIFVLTIYNQYIQGQVLITVKALETAKIQGVVLFSTTIIAIIVGYVGSTNAIRKYLKI